MAAVRRSARWGCALAAAVLAMPAAAQQGMLQGVWAMDDRGAWEELAPTDAAQQALARFDRAADDPSMRCVAPGLIRTAESRPPVEFVEQDHQILMIYESFNVVRRIYTNARPPPEWLPPSPLGYSVGAWHGDALVVETTHLTPHLLNDAGFPFSGDPAARIVERYRPSADRLELEFTVEDPVYLRQPATRTLTFDRMHDALLLHYACDPLDATGWRLPATENSLRDLRQWLDLRPLIPE